MADFVTVAAVSTFPASNKLCLELDGRYVVVVRFEDSFYCIDDVCTHDGGPLGDGELRGACLVCPRHGAEFDVRSGEAVVMPATEPALTHDVRIENDSIQVRLSDE